MKAYKHVAQTLGELGVKEIFGVLGDANLAYIIEMIESHGLIYRSLTIESSAVSASDGYSRATGKIGVASVTHGPGATNMLTALVEAVRASSRIVVITGDTYDDFGQIQDIDLRGLAKIAGASYDKVHQATSIRRDLERAFSTVEHTHRPLLLNIPHSVLYADHIAASDRPSRAPVDISVPQVSPDFDTVDDALGLMISANRPVILAGYGAVTSGARDELIQLSEWLGAPLATTLRAKDLFEGVTGNLGICGRSGAPQASKFIVESDCVLVFGASLNKYTTARGDLLSEQNRIIQCDTNPDALGRGSRVEIPIVGDAKVTAQTMLARLSEHGAPLPGKYRAQAAETVDAISYVETIPIENAPGTIDSRLALHTLNNLLPTNRQVITDVGRFMYAAWRVLKVPEPRRFHYTANFGSIGLGLGTAIGASIGQPEVLTVAVLGDGGFMMNAQELHTIAKYKLPLLVIVINDSAYGFEWKKIEEHGYNPEYSALESPSVRELGIASGVESYTVSNMSELSEAVQDASNNYPALLDVLVDPSVDIFKEKNN